MKTPSAQTYTRTKRQFGSRQETWAEADELLKRRLERIGAQPVTLPMRIRVKIPDRGGSNWYMQWAEHAGSHGALVQEVVEQIRAKWNLR